MPRPLHPQNNKDLLVSVISFPANSMTTLRRAQPRVEGKHTLKEDVRTEANAFDQLLWISRVSHPKSSIHISDGTPRHRFCQFDFVVPIITNGECHESVKHKISQLISYVHARCRVKNLRRCAALLTDTCCDDIGHGVSQTLVGNPTTSTAQFWHCYSHRQQAMWPATARIVLCSAQYQAASTSKNVTADEAPEL